MGLGLSGRNIMVKANIDLIMVCAGLQGLSDRMHIPLGLLYIGSILEREGYNVKIWHLLPEEFGAAVDQISNREPLWVGVSVLSGTTTYYAAQLSKLLRVKIPITKIVWGGHHPSAVPIDCIKEPYVDYVIHGEGEETAVEFSEALIKKQDMSKILGVCYKDRTGRPILNPRRPLVKELDKYELNWELINIEEYRRTNFHGKTPVNFYSSRGCPYNCYFCATPLYTGRIFRSHSSEYVIKNLKYLKERYGFNSVFFSDDNFMIDVKRSMDIISGLGKIGMTIDTIDVRLNQLNNRLLKKFSDYGVNGIFFGYESGNDRVLKIMNKKLTVDLIKEKVKLISSYGITAWASGIIGVPSETREEVYNTIDFSMWLRNVLPEGSTVSVFRYMPLPGTKLLELAVREGFVYPTNAEDWRKIDPLSPYYKMEWLKWVTDRDERYFATVQELSRNRMLNYISKKTTKSVVVATVNNFFVRRIRAKILSRKLHKWDLFLRLFDIVRNFYGLIMYKKTFSLRSKAVKE